MSKFVKICTPRSPHTPKCPHPKIGNDSLFPHPTTNPQHHPTTIPHISPQSPTLQDLNFPQKLNYLVPNTPKLNNFNNLIA